MSSMSTVRPAELPALISLDDLLEHELAPLAGRIDHEGFYPEAIMRQLGGAGVYARHLAAFAPGPRDLAAAIADMGAVAERCMSTAFCVWCQDACGWYLENTDNAELRSKLQGGIADGTLLGGTGLSNPIKALSGLEGFNLRATRTEGGYTVTGVLPWVSNLGDGHWFGTVFQDADDSDHKMMAMVQCGQPGVEIRQNVRYSVLEGTGTYSIRFKRAFIADAMMLADPLGDMIGRIRPGFVLLQTGMGLGVIRASIDTMNQCDVTHAHTNQFLPQRPAYFEDRLAAVQADVMRLAATPRDGAKDYVHAVLTTRLAVSELTLEAIQAAMMHSGARAFIEHAPVQRRLREGYFVAMITPSIRHLTQEIGRLTAA